MKNRTGNRSPQPACGGQCGHAPRGSARSAAAAVASEPRPEGSAAGGGLETLGLAELLALLPDLEAEIELGERRLRECVAMLRARRASWREIGEALEVSRQAAWARFQDASRQV